jgi:hypothetical protein
MDIPKVVAEPRSELKLVEASIHVLEQTGQSKETFTEADTKCRTREIAVSRAEELAMKQVIEECLGRSNASVKAGRRSDQVSIRLK